MPEHYDRDRETLPPSPAGEQDPQPVFRAIVREEIREGLQSALPALLRPLAAQIGLLTDELRAFRTMLAAERQTTDCRAADAESRLDALEGQELTS
jgi:hypothetical protein